jgi:hypothetical protein
MKEQPPRTSHQLQAKRQFRENLRLARKLLGDAITNRVEMSLKSLSQQFNLSLSKGDLQFTNGCWYVTHSGLLRLAGQKKCRGIHVEAVDSLCEPAASRFVFKATVHPTKSSFGFMGYGDADPSNVSSLVRGAEMRVAETRAVNRALRKAYGIGICSVEEVGSFVRGAGHDQPPIRISALSSNSSTGNNGHGGPRVRDRLCQLIRQHHLDPDLVKAYAVDFCGTKTLKEAARIRVERFVDHLADWAAKDRDALLCQLNSYPLPADKSHEKDGVA